jgi:hypothetical protein
MPIPEIRTDLFRIKKFSKSQRRGIAILGQQNEHRYVHQEFCNRQEILIQQSFLAFLSPVGALQTGRRRDLLRWMNVT